MGDCHYWLRPEDVHCYNKLGKDLDAKLESPGAEEFVGLGLEDDRDIRDERQAQSFEPACAFMVRVGMPGGVCDPQQWLLMDQISDEHGNGSFKISRQMFQFHGVIKRHLKPAIQDINCALLDTLAARGDANRLASFVRSL